MLIGARTAAWSGGGGLPEGAVKVEYLESTGKQYIDTGILVSGNVSFDFRGSVVSFASSAYYAWFFGTNSVVKFGFRTGATGFANNTDVFCGSRFSPRNEHYLDYIFNVGAENGTVYFDGSNLGSSSYVSDTNTLNIFNCYKSPYIYANMRVYGFWFSFGGNEYNLIPVKKPDGKGYMFDTVHEVFYGKTGTEDFIVGPEI